MKILQLITGLAMGGAEKMVVDLSIKSKKQSQYKFCVVSLTDHLDRKTELEQNGIPVYSLSLSKNILSLQRGIKQLKLIVESHKVDLIHVHMFHGFLLTLLSGLTSHLPVIFTGHNTNFGSKGREYLLWAFKAYREYDIIFDPNQIRYFHKRGNRTRIIPNGVDVYSIIAMQKSIPKNEVFTFINVGNIERQKNQIAFIDIAFQLKKLKKNFQIQIIGEGSKQPALEKTIRKYELENEVKLLGKRQNVPELMAAAHCFVMPSLWEGMPITVLEAGVTGIPIIASPVGNIPQILSDERGFVVEIDEFPEKMIWVMQNYHEALKRADKLAKHIRDEFSLDTTFQKHIELYHKVLGT